MELVRKTLLLVLLATITNAENNEVLDYSGQLERAIHSLNRVLDYLVGVRTTIPDLLFGVILARGQLVVLQRHIAEQDNGYRGNLSTLSNLQRKCEEIYKIFMPLMESSEEITNPSLKSTLLTEYLWEVDVPITLGRLPNSGIEVHKGMRNGGVELSHKEERALTMKGHPNGPESDECLDEIASGPKCRISYSCLKIILGGKATGYPLTHKLLYFQVARQVGCNHKLQLINPTETIRELCSHILEESRHLVKLNMPIGMNDLFMEQVALCGLEGFAEFLKPEFIDRILLLQTESGCFKDTKDKERKRQKRNDGLLEDDGCTMHITGLGAFYLAVNIRAIVEFWNPSIKIPSI